MKIFYLFLRYLIEKACQKQETKKKKYHMNVMSLKYTLLFFVDEFLILIQKR